MRSDACLCTLERSQKEARLPINLFCDEVLFLAFELDRLLDNPPSDFEQGCCCLDQLIMMDGTMAILSTFLEDVTHPPPERGSPHHAESRAVGPEHLPS